MATQPDNQYFVCRKCREGRPVDRFAVVSGFRLKKCKDCYNAGVRLKYAKRQGQYASHDDGEKKRQRRDYARERKGKYIWECSWLADRPTKECSQCKIELPANPAWFPIETRNTTGLKSQCVACSRKYHWENRQKILSKKREKHLQSDSEHNKKLRSQWRKENREKIRYLTKKWRSDNRDEYLRANVAKEHRRRARKIAASGTHSAAEIKDLIDKQKGKCWYCAVKLKKYHVDHRIPLARGGSNGIENIVIACPPCNLRKGAKMPWELENPRLI